MRKNIQILSRQFCSSKNPLQQHLTEAPLIKNRTPSAQIPVRHFEFEPFKFSIERQNIIYGYTLEEIYGRYHGLKHSPAIQKEISKDSLLITFIVIANLFFIFDYQRRDTEEQKDWLNYYYSDMNNKRDNIPNKQ